MRWSDMTITDYLYEIYEEFKEALDDKNEFCNLRNVNFDGNSLPDYSNPEEALLYCLRYHYGYAFEYEVMYNKILPEFKDRDTISVVSIGCGNGIDLWSLEHGIERLRLDISRINYTGIDGVDWINKIITSDKDSVNYFNCEVREAGPILNSLDNVDILMFPKSINEVNVSDLRFIEQILSKKTDNIYILASFRKNDYYLKSDINKFNLICSLFENDGFILESGESDAYYCYDEPKGIRSYFDDYLYPEEILDYIENLYNNCNAYDANELDCKYCESRLTRRPILKTSLACYNYVKLKRDGQ